MSEPRRQCILNVDDNEAGRYATSRILKAAGFEVLEAATGADALRLMAERPDLVLLDVNLPDIGGFEVCARIKADPANAGIAVVHLSATAIGSDARTEGLEGGADGYITQPVSARELVASLRATLRLREVQQELRESEERYRQLFEAESDAVLLVDDDTGAILEANGAAATMYGYGRDEILGLTDVDLSAEPEPTPAAIRFAAPIAFQRRKDGSRFPVEVHGRSFTLGGRTVRIAAVHDITERRRAEQEILRLNVDLERRVAERTAQLETSNMEFESFAYSVSHDLRAPLRALSGFSTIVIQDYGDRLDDEGRGHLQRIHGAAQRMTELVDGLLTLSRLNRDDLRLEQIDITEMATAVLDDLREGDAARTVEAAVAPGLTAVADRKLVLVVFENLLGNAWKFTARHEAACIEVGADELDGRRAFFVRDDGAGFDMAYVDKLFGAFQRLHSPGEFEGLGIGLATVERIAHRHGGRAWAEGDVEKGATFWFTLDGGAG